MLDRSFTKWPLSNILQWTLEYEISQPQGTNGEAMSGRSKKNDSSVQATMGDSVAWPEPEDSQSLRWKEKCTLSHSKAETSLSSIPRVNRQPVSLPTEDELLQISAISSCSLQLQSW